MSDPEKKIDMVMLGAHNKYLLMNVVESSKQLIVAFIHKAIIIRVSVVKDVLKS